MSCSMRSLPMQHKNFLGGGPGHPKGDTVCAWSWFGSKVVEDGKTQRESTSFPINSEPVRKSQVGLGLMYDVSWAICHRLFLEAS